MTMKQIKLAEKKVVNQIEKGTILKKNGDMFIVAKISEAQFNTVVDQALFSPRYDNSHVQPKAERRYTAQIVNNRPVPVPVEAVRNPQEAKYVLISLTTGGKFYPEFLTLDELLMRVSRAGFEIVNSIEIQEIQ